MNYKTILAVTLCLAVTQVAGAADLEPELKAVDAKVIAWRRDFHQNPELSNREVRTSKIVADHLASLGLKVETGIAKTGVVALLDTGKAGPTIALRADMDALPVTERTDVDRKSTRLNSSHMPVSRMPSSA